MKNIINNKLVLQIIKFTIVGVIAFIIDYGTLIILKELFKINLFISTELAFIFSVIINYYLSVKYVFNVNNKNNNFIPFIILSFIGLILTELIMYVGVKKINKSYLIVKIIATIIVMIFNFITRKILLEKKQKILNSTNEWC